MSNSYINRGGFRAARSTRPAAISNAAKRPSSVAPIRAPSKAELREELAKAAANTATDHKLYGARNYPL